MSDNLKVWDSFGKTDPAYTKSNNEGGRKSTSITPIYMVKQATEALGMIGEKWGYSVENERFDNTAPIVLIEGNKLNGVLPTYMIDNGSIVWEKTHTVLLKMWVGTKDNTFLQYGHTKYSYMTKSGKYYIDHDYGKKSITDAMTKCLSLIGVCSDIYMGEYDDKGYQEAAKLENDLKKANDRDVEAATKTDEFNAFIEDTIKAMELCPNFQAAAKIYGLAANKVDREAPILGIDPAEAKAPLDRKYFELQTKFEGK